MSYPTTFPPDAADQSVLDLSGTACARLTAPGALAARLAALDERYVRSSFVPLDDLSPAAARIADPRREIGARRLPQPAYRLDDGVDYVPEDFYRLVDEAGSVEALPQLFRSRYRAAATALALPADDADDAAAWEDYLSGGYLVCLRQATPENIAAKAHFIVAIEDLLAHPRADRAEWCRSLREAVERLQRIERPGAVLDPVRWGGPMSPQWYGSYLRARYPGAFAAGAGQPKVNE